MDTKSIIKAIEKKFHLEKSKDDKKLKQKVGKDNLGHGYYTTHDFVGDFRVKKYLNDWGENGLYRLYLDSEYARKLKDDLVDFLNDLDGVNVEFIHYSDVDFTIQNIEESYDNENFELKESLDFNDFVNLFLDTFSLIFLFSQRKNIKKALGYKENESIIKTLISNVKKALEEMNDDSRIN